MLAGQHGTDNAGAGLLGRTRGTRGAPDPRLVIGVAPAANGTGQVDTGCPNRARDQDVLTCTEPHLPHDWTMARTGVPSGLAFASEHLPA